MAFREIRIMDAWEIVRRWHDGQKKSSIAEALGYDRKTVRRYIHLAQSKGLSRESPLPEREVCLSLLGQIDCGGGRTPEAQDLLEQYLGELQSLVNDGELALAPKHAFEVLRERHNLAGKVSYSSFKRFALTHQIALDARFSTCRREVGPGSELQIDYGRIGLWFDHLSGRRRVLYAFIGTLSHSRHKYVELAFTQDQKSFVSSHARMFEYFGGVADRIILDNLKAGVIKPNLYDPRLNRSYQEMSEHYHVFIDPARVARPKDKGKVERDVRTVRQAARKIMVLNPTAGLAELNHLMLHWCREEYGQRKHGTTGEQPYVVFCEKERPALKALPSEPFELVEWKEATVHADHYIQFKGKAYSVPHPYVGRKVWIRAGEHLLKIFHNEELVAQHVIGKGYRHTDYSHFPDNVRAALDTGLQKGLLERSLAIGTNFHQIIRDLLEAHAFINLRRALGLVAIAEQEQSSLVDQAAAFALQHHLILHPRLFRELLSKLRLQSQTEQTLPLSEETLSFVRDVTYFIRKDASAS